MEYKEVGAQAVTYIKPGNMKKGDTVEGKFAGSYSDQYEKLNFRIEQPDGSVKIINGTALLEQKLAGVELGAQVKVIYEGTNKLTKGKFAGKDAHNFRVLVASAKAAPATTSTDALPF